MDVSALLARYNEWTAARARLWMREDDGHEPGSTEWQNSDDEGVLLAHDLAAALREVTG